MESDQQQSSFSITNLPTVGKFGAHRQFQADGASRDRRRQMLGGEHEVFATTLVALLTAHFGNVQWFDWDPDTLGQEVEDDFAVKMPIVVRDKIWALVSSLTTDRFYHDPTFFNHVCNALAGGPTPMTEFEPATLDEQAWGVLEIRLSDSEDGEQMEEFGAEVAGFVAASLAEEDLQPFPPLEFAPSLDQGGFGMATDEAMVAATFKDRQDRINSIQDQLLANVDRLHRELNALHIAGDLRKQRQRTGQ